MKTAGILSPLIIGEFVKDPEQRWRLIRLATIATTLVFEGLWTHKISLDLSHSRRDQHSLRSSASTTTWARCDESGDLLTIALLKEDRDALQRRVEELEDVIELLNRRRTE